MSSTLMEEHTMTKTLRCIPFDVDTINAFLGTKWQIGDTPCQYAQLVEGGIDYGRIEQTYPIPNNMEVVKELYVNARTHHDQDL